MNNPKDSSPHDDKKVAESTSTTHSQGDNTQSDKDSTPPPYIKQDEMQNFATKADVESVTDVIIQEKDDTLQKTDAQFATTNKKIDATNADVKAGFVETDKKIDKTNTKLDQNHRETKSEIASLRRMIDTEQHKTRSDIHLKLIGMEQSLILFSIYFATFIFLIIFVVTLIANALS